MSLRGIIFDIDNTFFDGSYWHRLLHQMISKLGLREQFQTFRDEWQTTYLPKVYQGELKYWDALASFFCYLGLSPVEARELLVSSQAKLKHAQANLRPFAQVSETLAELQRRQFRLAIVCNSIHQSHALLGMLADINIRFSFDSVLTSRSLGRVLPDREALLQAAREMLIAPQEAAYVSTRANRLQIAGEVEMVPVWLIDASHAETVEEHKEVPAIDHLIGRFADLIPWVTRLEATNASR
ncbi:MAG TPA: HAD family hydrolase [Pirellulaceae bacterium]|nr:HAD family hydrolase [Pirellulaceae bacterium]